MIIEFPQSSPTWTWPVVLTLCVAGLALSVSIGALAWQIHSWRRSGARLKVLTINGIGGVDPSNPVSFVGVQATNTGRLAAEITGFGFQLTGGKTIQALTDAFGRSVQLPQTLNPGGKVSVHYDLDGLRVGIRQAANSGAGARPYVDTGGQQIFGKEINLAEWVDG